MKITIPAMCPSCCTTECEGAYGTEIIEATVPTSDLIKELRKRAPKNCANRCEYIGSEVCGGCIWGLFIGDEIGGVLTANFKERK